MLKNVDDKQKHKNKEQTRKSALWQITLIWIQAASHHLEKALSTKRFMVYCTRLLFPVGLTDSSVESSLFVFKALLLCPLNSIRVKEEVIVREKLSVILKCSDIKSFQALCICLL